MNHLWKLALILFLAGCNGGKLQEKELRISAPSSMKNAMETIEKAFEKTSDYDVTLNFASSGTLAQQIHQGAPVDIYISASKRWMDDVVDARLMKYETITTIAKNRMVLVTNKNDTDHIKLKDISSTVNQFAMGDPASVPAGSYAKEVLQNIGTWEHIKSRIVYGKNVRQVAAYVESGNVDAGIVYQSDATALSTLYVLEKIPENLHTPIAYPGGIVKSSKEEKAAKEFLRFLKKDEAQKILSEFGFEF